MEDNKPLLIVVSIVRNEAWVLNAFLSAASLWADMIVIADQMSTDGSREIYKQYPKVHVIDNDMPNMHQAAARRLVLEETRRILNGNDNAILFALDADEILGGNFMQSPDWKQIIYSKPNDCFEWRWMNLLPGDTQRCTYSIPTYWGVHVSEQMWDGIFPDNKVHEWRLPFPNSGSNEIELYSVFSIHFFQYNRKRQWSKVRFYQVNSLEDRARYNVINLYRQYHSGSKQEYHQVPADAYAFYQQNGLDVLSLIETNDDAPHFTEEVKSYFSKYGTSKYAMLDIWDKEWCEKNNIAIPQRTAWQKLVMWYLKKSTPYFRSIFIRGIDYLLKKLYKRI